MASTNPRWKNGYRRRQEQRRWRASGAPCYICGRPIDYSLKSPDPWSFVIDETLPLARGGRVCHSNSGPAHRWCNGLKGTHSLEWARNEVAKRLQAGSGTIPTKATSLRFESSDW
ncbi:HNH nuclease [Bifidobacterium vansinderenii]|uniref:HNH nuclease n=1 Tax=Bifidobacterium vansinderenii TaxID=1984871 RepID=A0A229W1B7_9BIFI|nr:HNH nuclease [Bifidobacterium vansinderenii]